MDAVYDHTQILPSIDRDGIARLSVLQSQRTDPSAMRSRERTRDLGMRGDPYESGGMATGSSTLFHHSRLSLLLSTSLLLLRMSLNPHIR